jgi:hypothetical protein
MKSRKYVALSLFLLTVWVAFEIRRHDMQPETHHETNSPSPHEGMIYGGYAGS